MLNERSMNDLAAKKMQLTQVPFQYRIALISEIATSLGIELNTIEN
jgi:hypothetical protein